MSEWIKVEDRLPDGFESVIAAGLLDGDEKVSVNEAYYAGRWESVRGHTMLRGVTHWMPLPQPPKV